MTACKENRSTGKIVIVDTTKGDLQQLPKNIQDSFSTKGNVWPKMVITDPAMSKIYGAYSYNELKPQEYRKLLRDAVRAFKADAKAGTLTPPGERPADEKAAGDEKGSETKEPLTAFEPTDFEKWQSAKGTTIEARLIAIDEEGRFVFEDRKGRKIPVSPTQLDEPSRRRAQLAASEG